MPKSHTLIWMSVTKAQCACGENYEVTLEDVNDLSNAGACQNALLDKHLHHTKTMKRYKL